MEAVINQFLNGLSFVAVLGLIGVGLAVLLGMMGVINLAHGEFVMLGAYMVWVSGFIFHNFWVGLALAVVAVGLFSLLIERALMRPLYQRPMETILVTWGLGIILRELVKLVFGKSDRLVEAPIPGFVSIWGVHYSAYRLFVICMAIVVLFSVVAFFLTTEYGLRARAIIFNRQMASALGVNVARVNQLMFALGAGLAALAGGLISPIYVDSPYMGLQWVVGAFFVVVIGGVGNIWGPIGGATVMGGSQGITEYYLSPVVAQIIVLLVAIVVVRLRPTGLFSHH
jgi:urea transport system permease protein